MIEDNVNDAPALFAANWGSVLKLKGLSKIEHWAKTTC